MAVRQLLLGVAIVLTAACDPIGSAVIRAGTLKGLELDPPLEKPAFVFPTADGKTFDFQKETDGEVALLFFGYTYCPDICPVHMTNITAALSKMSDADARRVNVIFVTTDPARDTEQRLSQWLNVINPRIIGLRPSTDDAIRLQSTLGIQPAMLMAPKPGHEGNYEVSHAAQIVAFGADNKGRSVYAAGTRQSDWAHDIPLLLRMKAR